MLCKNVTADINGHLLANVAVVHNFSFRVISFSEHSENPR